jgi:purine-binding chemotaxis protein CheW
MRASTGALIGSMPGQQHVIFELEETRFGVEIDQVLRVIRLTSITRVPHAPGFLEGVINDHGQIIPIVDLKKRLALSSGQPYGEKSRILVIELDKQPIGMLVDRIIGIWRIPSEAVEPAPEMVAQVNGLYLTGVARAQDRLIILLNLSTVLTADEADQVNAWQARQDESQ